MSTSRTERHRTSTGENLGTLRAREPELLALASVLRARDAGVFQFLSDSYRTTDDEFARSEFELVTAFARTSRRPVSYTVQQDIAAPERWRDLMALAAQLQAEGLDVKAQVAPRPIGVLLGLQASANVFTPSRAYMKIAGLPVGERIAALRDPERRRRILDGHAQLTSGVDAFAGYAFFGRFDEMYVLDDPVDYDLDSSRSLGALARRAGVDPAEYAYDVQLQRDGSQLIYTPLFNFAHGNLDAVHEMITSPVAMFGLSDAGAHCGQICDGSMTTTYLSLWARDRRDRDGMPLEAVVHQISQRPAAHFGWLDRGVVAPGYLADLNVIDLDHLECAPPEIATDLPAGGRRLLQAATGLPVDAEAGSGDLRGRGAHGRAPGRAGPRRPARPGQGPRLTTPDVLPAILDHVATGPDRPAVKDLERDLTYRELGDDAALVAAGLGLRGVEEGDRVALHLPNSVDFVVAALACLWIGAIFVPLAVTDPVARLETILGDCTPAVVITSDDRADGTGEVPVPDRARLVGISELRRTGGGPGCARPRLDPCGLCHLHVRNHRHAEGGPDRQPCLRRGRGRIGAARWVSAPTPARCACRRSTSTGRSARSSRPCSPAGRSSSGPGRRCCSPGPSSTPSRTRPSPIRASRPATCACCCPAPRWTSWPGRPSRWWRWGARRARRADVHALWDAAPGVEGLQPLRSHRDHHRRDPRQGHAGVHRRRDRVDRTAPSRMCRSTWSTRRGVSSSPQAVSASCTSVGTS